MKYLILITILSVLSGCAANTHESTNNFILPNELKDCRIYYLESGLSYLCITRCPNSITSTSFKVGKSQSTSVTIDGVKYVKESE